MGVFLKRNVSCSENDYFVFTNKHFKVEINFKSDIIPVRNYILSKKTHTNQNVHGKILPVLTEVGYIEYNKLKTKILYSNELEKDVSLLNKNLPTATPQYINNEFVILVLAKPKSYLHLITIILHELGHIVTLKQEGKDHYIKDLSKLLLSGKGAMYMAGRFEGLADAFAYAKAKGTTEIISFLKEKYYLLAYGSEDEFPQLIKIRQNFNNFESYKSGYCSVIKKDIYSSDKVREFL
jgi:hypothetical protein